MTDEEMQPINEEVGMGTVDADMAKRFEDEAIRIVEAGEAKRRDGKTLPFGGDDMFWLTKAGALLALNPGERLDPQDFPQ